MILNNIYEINYLHLSSIDEANSSVESTSSSDEEDDPEYNERRDLCVAHFYKFQEESGNQLNRVPMLGGVIAFL